MAEVIYAIKIVLLIFLILAFVLILFFTIHPIWFKTKVRVSSCKFYRLELIITYFVGLIKFFVIKTEKNSLVKVQIGTLEKKYLISGKLFEKYVKNVKKTEKENIQEIDKRKHKEESYQKLIETQSRKVSESVQIESKMESGIDADKPQQISEVGIEKSKDEKTEDYKKKTSIKREEISRETHDKMYDNIEEQIEGDSHECDEYEYVYKEAIKKDKDTKYDENLNENLDLNENKVEFIIRLKKAFQSARNRAKAIFKIAKDGYKKIIYLWAAIKPLLIKIYNYGIQIFRFYDINLRITIGAGKPHLTGILCGFFHSICGVLYSRYSINYGISTFFFRKIISFNFSCNISIYPYKLIYGVIRIFFSKEFYNVLRILYRYYFYGKFTY